MMGETYHKFSKLVNPSHKDGTLPYKPFQVANEHQKQIFGSDQSLSMGISPETQNLRGLINFNMFLQPERKCLVVGGF